MTKLPNDERSPDAMIFTTDHGPMLVSRQHSHPQLVTDPELLAILSADQASTP